LAPPDPQVIAVRTREVETTNRRDSRSGCYL
jgi:hypothetical protein